jgi:tetratricopeptide (TPR) repeat protein
MDPNEGTLFLLHRSALFDPHAPLEASQVSDRTIAREIVQEMDGLPLALEQAGAYIEETACGLQGYLRLYQAQGVQLLTEHSEFGTDHPKPVATTWSLSFERVEQANAAAAELLCFCAFLAPDAIPEELFAESAAELGPLLEPVASDPSRLNAAIKELLKYSLVQRVPETQTLSIHRLVQEVLKDQMDEEAQRAWAERAVRAVNSAFPEVEFESWDRCRRMLTHAQACADLISQWNVNLPEAASLLYKTGSFLDAHGQYVEAEPFLQGALVIGEQSLGPDHPDVALYLNDLAGLYLGSLGKIAEAEPLIQHALNINEQNFGPDHPNTATTLHSLANLNWAKWKVAEADLLFQRVLAIRERTLGPDHPLTANSIHALAAFYREQGRYAEAEPLYQRALEIKEQTLRPEHPDIVDLLSNMAQLYGNQSKYAEAETLLQRALAIGEQTLGPDHPDTARTLNRMADLYQAQGKHEQAELLYQRALAIYEQANGPDYSDTYTLEGLANLYRNQGKYAEAEPLYQRALAIKEQTLVPDHPSIEHTLEKYARLLRQMQRTEEATQLEERVRELRARRSS